ncbi:MAG: cell division protein FtsL [Uliginosibacterium sp.]|nr:cell division protein FtsL [Uliginosibacterium sp.]MBK9394522.1 cell division protein FtsL [Uliginosibacterium sp.]MBK9616407.1 cell division protein FtsL [Uliginosibacterium sp.]
MIRVTAALVAASVASALGVVASQHQSRKLVTEIEKEQGRTQALKIEWDQLQLESGAVGARQRVEKIAREQLRMRLPEHDNQIVLEPLPEVSRR